MTVSTFQFRHQVIVVIVIMVVISGADLLGQAVAHYRASEIFATHVTCCFGYEDICKQNNYTSSRVSALLCLTALIMFSCIHCL